MALDAITHISIDLANPGVTATVRAVQEDLRSRFVEVELLENKAALEIPAGTNGMIGIRTPTNVHILYDEDEDGDPAVVIDGNVATCYLRQEALANPGQLYVNLILQNGTRILTSFAFFVNVEAVAVPSGAVVQSDYFNYLSAQIEAAAAVVDTATGIVDDCTDEADRAKTEADRAESYASGVQYPVSYDTQTLTDSQKAQARTNIYAASQNHHSTHATGGSDALTPSDIGAAADSDLTNYIPVANAGAASGVATLDSDAHLTPAQGQAKYRSISSNTTIQSSDADTVLLATGTITVTLASLDQGTEFELWNKGSGIVTLSGTMFVSGYGSLSTAKLNSNSVCVCKRMNSVWHVAGGVSS